ncbi:MAG: patatin-like phospholipase family protein [Candidatus Dormibacteria bacterium]
MKIGLVMGGGGFVGGAWLTGALEALEGETGVLPSRFDNVVGTSAGAMIAALTASGVAPSVVAEIFSGRMREGTNTRERPDGASLRLERGIPLPGSVRLALDTLRHPRQHPVGVAVAALLPKGVFSTQPLKDTVRKAIPTPWSPHKGLWIMACDLGTGRRVAFGREGSPEAQLPDAVAASCAIPGFYRPVAIGGRHYVDGGVCSPSNLDVLRNSGLDLVICLNPTSSVETVGGRRLRERIGDAYRGASRAQLEREVVKLRAAGTKVLCVQPTTDDLRVMGTNLMAAGNLEVVSEVARRTVARQLHSPQAAEFVRALGSLTARRRSRAA